MNAQQMKDGLFPARGAENRPLCMNCADPAKSQQQLQFCSACRCVKYCSKSCQRADWTKHKQTCKILRSFRKAAAETTTMWGGGWRVGNKAVVLKKFDRFEAAQKDSSESEDAWTRARRLVRKSPFCAVCEKSDFDCQGGEPIQWTCCPRCNYGWCCSQEHFEEYRAKHTRAICDNYLRATMMDLFRYNNMKNQGDAFMAMPHQPLATPMPSFPSDWDEWFRIRMPWEYGTRDRLPTEFFPCSTFLLSQVNTILFGMYQHDKELFLNKEELTIHVLGPSETFEYEGGAPTCIWEEIMHCLPAVKRMNVVFVGPEGGLDWDLSEIGACPDCTAKGRVRRQGFRNITYQEYRAREEFVRPDFVAAFNTGMYEEYTDSWKESLRVLLDLEVPCIFTSYNRHEGDEDFGVLEEVNAQTLTDGPVLNPFAVDYPLIDDGPLDGFYQHSMYYICFRGYKM